jgi:hypothetical protein
VSEYFLFDPTEYHLHPPLQGYRLVGGDYIPIGPIAGGLPSEVIGLHLERDGKRFRLVNPATGQRLLTPVEGREVERRRASAAEADSQRLAQEVERLRREIEALRRG